MDYLVRLVQEHEDFRQAELEALASLVKVNIQIVSYTKDSPFCIVRFPCTSISETAVTAFISRAVLSKGIYELWATGTTYTELHRACAERSQSQWGDYRQASFKFSFDIYCGKRSSNEQREIINSFRYLSFEGPIQMAHPDAEFTIFEEWDISLSPHHQVITKQNPSASESTASSVVTRAPTKIFFGRKIATSPRSILLEKHSLKTRPYISTTSMDAALALTTANLALSTPGKLFFDPFVGTGGFLLSAAEFGALTFGSDIDGRSFRGKGAGIEDGVGANFRKYELEGAFGDCVVADLTNTPLRTGRNGKRWLDGIICDPPYGVREGLKVLGTRSPRAAAADDDQKDEAVTKHDSRTQPPSIHLIDGVPAHTLPGYIAPKKPYALSRMLGDILAFAANTLVDDGRLAFWMPAASEEGGGGGGGGGGASGIPQHACLELLHCCVQPFNKWERRLLVYRRRRREETTDGGQLLSSPASGGEALPIDDEDDNDARAVQTGERHSDGGMGTTANDLNPFRRRYFQGFRG